MVYGCSDNSKTNTENILPAESFKLKIYYTYVDSLGFSDTETDISNWNLLFDSEKMKGLHNYLF